MDKEFETTATVDGEVLSEIVTVKQIPIIEEQLQLIKEKIENEVAYALSLEVNEDTVKEVKKVRTSLKKDYDELEARRKDVKKAILTPYDEFEAVYKVNVTNVFKPADTELKRKIDAVEEALKNEKKQKAIDYFNEYAASASIDFITFDMMRIDVTMSVSLKKLKETAKEFIDKVVGELALIDTQENASEILVEYKRTLDVAKSITSVVERHKRIEEEKQKAAERAEAERLKAEAEAKVEQAISKEEPQITPPIAAPVTAPVASEPLPEKEQVLAINFTVRGTRRELKALKEFLNNGGYDYEC